MYERPYKKLNTQAKPQKCEFYSYSQVPWLTLLGLQGQSTTAINSRTVRVLWAFLKHDSTTEKCINIRAGKTKALRAYVQTGTLSVVAWQFSIIWPLLLRRSVPIGLTIQQISGDEGSRSKLKNLVRVEKKKLKIIKKTHLFSSKFTISPSIDYFLDR